MARAPTRGYGRPHWWTAKKPGDPRRIRCRGRRCAFKRLRKRFRRARRVVSFTRAFKRRKLRQGTVVELRVTQPRHIGLVRRYKVRGGRRLPRQRDLCLAPGARKPRAC